MIGLFQSHEAQIFEIDLRSRVRSELNLALNKGIILSWDELKNLLPLSCDLIEAKNYYEVLVENKSLIDALSSISFTECYLHRPGVIRYKGISDIKENVTIDMDDESWQIWFEILAIKYHQNWNCQNPFVSFRVEINNHPYRFSLLHYKATSSPYSKLVIRNLQANSLPLRAFGSDFDFSSWIKNKANILICGSTGSGKTSLLNSLLQETSINEHLVVLEDTQELILPHSYCTRFLAQEHPSYSLEQFLTYSLRLSPDRIILGEMRSSEVVSYVLAMNTGHRGVMSTIHANSAVDGINRVSMMFNLYGRGLNHSEVMNLITRNLDLVVYIENKQIKEVIRPLGADQAQAYYETLFNTQDFH